MRPCWRRGAIPAGPRKHGRQHGATAGLLSGSPRRASCRGGMLSGGPAPRLLGGCYRRLLRLAACLPPAGRPGVGFVLSRNRFPRLVPVRDGPPTRKSSTVGGSPSSDGNGTADSVLTG